MMKKTMFERLKAAPKWIWVLCAIVALGIFLRTFEFRDWMTFNPDQARDALLVQDMLAGKQWPLMGPQAGNTYFQLGPIFYYFEFISAWLFGSSAEKMAYPDLLFSILSIPLLFFFLRRFFETNLALMLTFLFSISFFVVTYSRFAFNPNSIPFFTILFLSSLLAIMDGAPKEKLVWAAILGIAMGVGFQLHAILFIAMPLLALLTLGYLFFKKYFVWKSVLIAFLFFCIMNTGQLVSEVQNHGENLKSFFSGASSSARDTDSNLWKNFSNDTLCHIQGEIYILTSLGSGDKCDLPKLASRIEKKGWRANLGRLSIAIFGSLFTIGGFALFFLAAKKEKDFKQRRALILVAIYSLLVFIVLFPVSSSVSIRYFIVVEFMPFLLLGFWVKLIFEKIHGWVVFPISGILLLMVAISNGGSLWNATGALRAMTASTDNVAYFGEVALMSQYLFERAPGAETIYLSGKKAYLSRYGKQLEYFGRRQDVAVKKVYKLDSIKAGDSFFYVLKRISKKDTLPEVIKGFTSEHAYTRGNVSIMQLVRVTDN